MLSLAALRKGTRSAEGLERRKRVSWTSPRTPSPSARWARRRRRGACPRALPTYQLTLGLQLADSGFALEKHAGLAMPASARSSQQGSQQGSRPYQGLGVAPVPGRAGKSSPLLMLKGLKGSSRFQQPAGLVRFGL